jgi:hypothetical protein
MFIVRQMYILFTINFCETQCYMFRTLSRFIFRDFSILNYTDFLQQWYNYTIDVNSQCNLKHWSPWR